MKLLHLLLSLCLALVLCAAPLIRAQTVPAIPTAAPTPPNGAPGDNNNGPPPPPTMATTVKWPDLSTIYDDYAG